MYKNYIIIKEEKLKKVVRYYEFKTREYVQILLYDEDD